MSADPLRCETNRLNIRLRTPSFMTFGPVRWERCTNAPRWIARDVKGGEMSLCDECKTVCEQHMPNVIFTALEP